MWHNIWDDEQARAFVRSVNNGDETVPTVRVGPTTLTNPSGAQVARLLTGDEPLSPKPGRGGAGWWLTRWVRRGQGRP